jgi:hypothetical protein
VHAEVLGTSVVTCALGLAVAGRLRTVSRCDDGVAWLIAASMFPKPAFLCGTFCAVNFDSTLGTVCNGEWVLYLTVPHLGICFTRRSTVARRCSAQENLDTSLYDIVILAVALIDRRVRRLVEGTVEYECISEAEDPININAEHAPAL